MIGMGLITEKVMVKWHSSNRKYYEEKGYEFTGYRKPFYVNVNDLNKYSKIYVKCECDNCGKDLLWQYADYVKQVKDDGSTYCSKCAITLYGYKKRNKNYILEGRTKSFKEWCVLNNKYDILNRWDYEKNEIDPSEVTFSSSKKFWFKCLVHPEHGSEKIKINRITGFKLMDRSKCSKCNSFAQWMIDNLGPDSLEKYWDYNKNEISPWDLSYGATSRVWIYCQEKDYHDSYQIICSNFVQGYRCCYCRKGIHVHPKDSLGQYVIDNFGEKFLDEIWSDKNTISPFEISKCSAKKVWFNCINKKHEPSYRICSHAYNVDFKCPKCNLERKESIIEEKTRKYLIELGYNVKTELDCSLIPINPKTGHYLPYDNEIVLKNGVHLIIEVNGAQHYKTSFKFKQSQEVLEKILYQRKLYDRYKRIYCKIHGYEYLELSYKYFKNDHFKNVINTKIKEILNYNK